MYKKWVQISLKTACKKLMQQLRRKRGSTSLDLKLKVISNYADKLIDSRQQQQQQQQRA